MNWDWIDKKNDEEKIPIGLIPPAYSKKYQERFQEVCEAIKRYWDAEIEIPLKWVEEHNILIRILKDKSLRRKI